jgi:NAD(P)-dependent dehydrogenase (short-subunit alcohol dehydrogenase family)
MTTSAAGHREGGLTGQTVLVIGGSSGIGLETARQAHQSGAEVAVTGRDPDRLERAARELGAIDSSVLEIGDGAAVERLFDRLSGRIDHVLVTGGGPGYATIPDIDFDEALRVLDEHLLGSLRIARACAEHLRPGGSLTLISGTHARRPGIGLSTAAIGTVAIPVIAANAAVELAPMRVNAVAAGFVDTPLSARILGDQLEQRRAELRATLPVRRVVEASDVAAVVIHLMTNTAVTGATYDVDGGQQLLR